MATWITIFVPNSNHLSFSQNTAQSSLNMSSPAQTTSDQSN